MTYFDQPKTNDKELLQRQRDVIVDLRDRLHAAEQSLGAALARAGKAESERANSDRERDIAVKALADRSAQIETLVAEQAWLRQERDQAVLFKKMPEGAVYSLGVLTHTITELRVQLSERGAQLQNQQARMAAVRAALSLPTGEVVTAIENLKGSLEFAHKRALAAEEKLAPVQKDLDDAKTKVSYLEARVAGQVEELRRRGTKLSEQAAQFVRERMRNERTENWLAQQRRAAELMNPRWWLRSARSFAPDLRADKREFEVNIEGTSTRVRSVLSRDAISAIAEVVRADDKKQESVVGITTRSGGRLIAVGEFDEVVAWWRG